MRWAGLVDAGRSWNHDGPVCSLVKLEEQITIVVVMFVMSRQQDAVSSIYILRICVCMSYHEGIVGVVPTAGKWCVLVRLLVSLDAQAL